MTVNSSKNDFQNLIKSSSYAVEYDVFSALEEEGLSKEDYLTENQEIKDVTDYESIEDQVSKIIFLATQ